MLLMYCILIFTCRPHNVKQCYKLWVWATVVRMRAYNLTISFHKTIQLTQLYGVLIIYTCPCESLCRSFWKTYWISGLCRCLIACGILFWPLPQPAFLLVNREDISQLSALTRLFNSHGVLVVIRLQETGG